MSDPMSGSTNRCQSVEYAWELVHGFCGTISRAFLAAFSGSDWWCDDLIAVNCGPVGRRLGPNVLAIGPHAAGVSKRKRSLAGDQ